MRNSDKLKDVPPENAQYVFWHPFIYICAFHFLFYKDPEFVLKKCNLDAILELVRPKDSNISYLEVAADDQYVTLFNERIHSLGVKNKYANHPLVQMDNEFEEIGICEVELNLCFMEVGMIVPGQLK